MPTPGEIRDAATTRMNNLVLLIVPKQEAYLNVRGRYWQGIVTPATIPTDGFALALDLSRRPTDQVERWADVASAWQVSWPATSTVQLQIDVYTGPQGKGWVFTARCMLEGRIWERAVNIGPEIASAHDWETRTVGVPV